MTDHAFEEIDHTLWEGQICALGKDIFRLEVVLHQEHRHVSNDFGRRGDLDDITKEVVDLAIHFFALFPAMTKTEAFDLRLIVGILTTGNLMVINLGSSAAQLRLKRLVVGAHGLPVVRQLLHPTLIQLRIPDGAFESREQSIHVWLGSQARHRRKCDVDNINSGLGCHQQHGAAIARSIMSVEMNRDTNLVLQGLDQFFCSKRLEQSGHIFDRQYMGAHVLQLFSQINVVLQRVLVAFGIENVSGVTHGCFAYRIGTLAYGLHGHLHALGPVQGVEDPENIDTALCRLDRELLNHVVRIVGVAHRVGTAQQHLKEDIGYLFTQTLETLPWILSQKAHGHVVGRPTPHFK